MTTNRTTRAAKAAVEVVEASGMAYAVAVLIPPGEMIEVQVTAESGDDAAAKALADAPAGSTVRGVTPAAHD